MSCDTMQSGQHVAFAEVANECNSEGGANSVRVKLKYLQVRLCPTYFHSQCYFDELFHG